MQWNSETEAVWLAQANSELRSEVLALKQEIERLRAEMSTMHRTVVHDCCVQVQSECRLADQLADALKAVQHDRPSAHTDNVWAVINHALNAYEEARRGQ